MTLIENEPAVRPTREQLLAEFGEADLSVQSLFRFCFVPTGRLGLLKALALDEDWGTGDGVLLKYLAVHVRLSIEQERFVWNEDQLVMTAGNLRTSTGVPIYIGLVRNTTSNENPWALNWVGDRPSCTELPEPPLLSAWDPIEPGVEIVLGVELEDSERLAGVSTLADAPSALRTAAIVGACHWAMHRGLPASHMFAGIKSYFIPLYFESRADLCSPPDLVCSVVVQSNRLLIRSVLDPEIAYPHARAVALRCDQLPGWLQESWAASAIGEGED